MSVSQKPSPTPDIEILFDPRLIAAGLNPRLVVLYGTLRIQADRDRKVQATHDMLAAKIGIRSREQVWRLLRQLRDLRLVEWQRGRDLNTYWVYEIDVAWVSAWKGRHG